MPSPLDVSDHPFGTVSEWGKYWLDLTGPRSHVLEKKPGQGRLVLGPESMGKKADLHVAPNDAINWSAFDPFSTPAGSAWPRHIDYHGNDSGFLAWSERRKTETVVWAPAFRDSREIDASGAQIYDLHLRLSALHGHLGLKLPAGLRLGLVGDLSRFAASGETPTSLALLPTLSRRLSDVPYQLPDLGILNQVESLILSGNPQGQPISLADIERFPALKSLSLHGNFVDWPELTKLQNLEDLAVRFVPDLMDFPALSVWPKLEMFIAFNVDEAAGKRLKADMKARAKLRAWSEYANVSKLRKPDWWSREYGRSFSAWAPKVAKTANAAYDTALTALELGRNEAEVKAAITAFAEKFNAMAGIETTERDDIGEAVWQFAQLSHVVALGVTEDDAQRWFDEVRDY